MNVLWGLEGSAVLFFLAFILCNDKKAIRLRPILGGLAIQLLFGLLVLKWSVGR